MRILKKICALVYLLATLVVVSCIAGLMYGPTAPRIERLFGHLVGCIVIGICAGIVFIGVLVTVIYAFTARREPKVICPAGNPQIQISLGALVSCARAAAAQEDEIMVEHVSCRIGGPDRSQAQFTIEAIAFSPQGLTELAQRVEARVQKACEEMLGAEGVSVRVRFLPSKTTVIQGGSS